MRSPRSTPWAGPTSSRRHAADTTGAASGSSTTAPKLERVVAEQLAAGVPLIAEEKVEWTRELSAMVARSPFGQGASWPVVETVQRDGQCAVVIAPAPDLPADVAAAAEQLALRIAAELGVVGVMAVELFETTVRRA